MRDASVALLALLVLCAAPVSAVAQQPADSIRDAALRDYHGPDLEGKDGPLAKVGLDLLVLYHEYRGAQKRAGSFDPSLSDLQVRGGFVTVDAVASDDAAQLRDDLEALGFQNAATAGRLVSGRLPIPQIPALADVESLRGIAPSRMQTRDDRAATTTPIPDERPAPDTVVSPPSPPEAPSPAADSPAAPVDSAAQTSPSPSPDSAVDDSPASDGETGGIGTVGIVVLLVALAGVVGVFVFGRR